MALIKFLQGNDAMISGQMGWVVLDWRNIR
jgi:hypothetical protein